MYSGVTERDPRSRLPVSPKGKVLRNHCTLSHQSMDVGVPALLRPPRVCVCMCVCGGGVYKFTWHGPAVTVKTQSSFTRTPPTALLQPPRPLFLLPPPSLTSGNCSSLYCYFFLFFSRILHCGVSQCGPFRLLVLSVVPWTLTLVFACVSSVFLFTAEECSVACRYPSLFNPSPSERCMSCF